MHGDARGDALAQAHSLVTFGTERRDAWWAEIIPVILVLGGFCVYATLRAFEVATEQLSAITGVVPQRLVADAHPAYRSAAWARVHAAGRPLRTVQHHHAHVASVMGDPTAALARRARSPIAARRAHRTAYPLSGARKREPMTMSAPDSSSLSRSDPISAGLCWHAGARPCRAPDDPGLEGAEPGLTRAVRGVPLG